jgi:hypothetical protein
MRRYPEQLADWLTQRNLPMKRNQKMIVDFLEGQVTDNEL